MSSRWNKVWSSLYCLLLLVFITGVARARTGEVSLKELHDTIATIRELSSPEVGFSNARTVAAERLFDLVGKINPKDVDDKTIGELVTLLDTWDVSVIVPVGTFLEDFGIRANSAAPKLLEILAESKCRPAFTLGLPEEYFINSVLRKIGTQTSPPLPFCDNVGAGVWEQWIRQEMESVLSSNSSIIQAKAAMNLAYLTALRPKGIDSAITVDLIPLLDIPNEAVREGIAMSLGNFGPLAQSAGKRLENLLWVAKCGHARPEYVGTIEKSLSQIGVTPHLPACEGA
jgi:hypothetical protein